MNEILLATGVHSHPTDFSQAVVRSAARGDVDSLRQSIVADARVVSATERDGTTIVHAAARFGSSGRPLRNAKATVD